MPHLALRRPVYGNLQLGRGGTLGQLAIVESWIVT